LRRVTFKGILGLLLPGTVGVAKLYIFHTIGVSGSSNFIRDRRTYRTTSDCTGSGQCLLPDDSQENAFSLISVSANLNPLPREEDEPGFEGEKQLYINPVECIDCGACVPVCPVSAIFALDDLPEKWNEFTARNAAYFGR